MNILPNLTIAGTWIPISDVLYSGSLTQTHHALIKLDQSGKFGLVVTGWSTSQITSKLSIALLDADSNGGLKLNTTSYIDDPLTYMSNSIVIADFNGDGKSDIFLAPYRENPFTSASTTVFLSNTNGGFSKYSISDSVIAHDAAVFNINGALKVFTATFTSASQSNPIYQFQNQGIIESQPANIKNLTGTSTAIIDNGNNAGLELIRSDGMNIRVYHFNGNDLISPEPVQIIKPYLSTLAQYNNLYPAGTYRVWADDINHDGKQDILAGESIFNSTGIYPSALQILINKGDGSFRDSTSFLNPDMSINTAEMDYSPSFIDIDKSGINTYLFAGSTSWGQTSRQSDYVLLNDGTGRLYVGLHDEFNNLNSKVLTYLANPLVSKDTPAKFIAIPQLDGSINFVAQCISYNFDQTNNHFTPTEIYVNIPLGYNPKTDFTQDVTITDRNNSMLMRTWAGNDTFYDTNANSLPAHIDGGLGNNTSTYSDPASKYNISYSLNSTEIKHVANTAAPNVDDTLVNIQNIRFADQSVDTSSISKTAALAHSQIVGLTQLYVASFNRAPDSVGLDYWGGRLSDGMSLQDIAKSFFVQKETVAAYPTGLPTSDFVTKVYNNVLSRGPDTGGLNYWVGQLNNGSVSKDAFLLAIINGAMAASGSAVDRQTLANKEAVGEHYAIYQGLNNSTTWAQDVMSGVTNVASTVTAANAKADHYAVVAANPATSDLVVKLVGVAV